MKELTSPEAARVLGLTHRVVNHHCRKGNIPAVKKYGMWFIKPSAVEAAKTMRLAKPWLRLTAQQKEAGQ